MGLRIHFVLLAVFGVQFAYAMDCSLGTSENVIEEFIRTCPRPIIDSKEEKYCCWSPSGDKVHCCNLTDFLFNSISIMLPLIIIGLVVSFIVSCVCCLCCGCCKRRGGGSLEQMQLQQQQVLLQRQQLQLQQQQLELDMQRQQLLAQQAMGMVNQITTPMPPPYTASAPSEKKITY